MSAYFAPCGVMAVTMARRPSRHKERIKSGSPPHGQADTDDLNRTASGLQEVIHLVQYINSMVEMVRSSGVSVQWATKIRVYD